jgi:hypothetical protein
MLQANMPPDICHIWTEDLINHPEAKGQGFLHYEKTDGTHHYCCLGRLCMLAVQAGVIPPPVKLTTEEMWDAHDNKLTDLDVAFVYAYGTEPIGSEHGNIFNLPPEVREWAGLDNPTGDFGWMQRDTNFEGKSFTFECASHLSILNDEDHFTFPQIADVIGWAYGRP